MFVIGLSERVENEVDKLSCSISSFSERMHWLNTDIRKIPSYD